jgi:hypothetical protein
MWRLYNTHVPRKFLFNPCTHRRQARRHQVPLHVGRRVRLSLAVHARHAAASINYAPCPVPASVLPGEHLSGRLTSIISLTKILNLFAKTSGLNPADLGEQRARREKLK